MKNAELRQWHDTHKIIEDGITYFLKNYKPNSYEIKNEISWLTSTMVNSCKTFDVPRIVDTSIERGQVKMEYIDITDDKSRDEITDFLIKCALELHRVIKSERPHLRNPISHDQYNKFLQDYTQQRIASVDKSEFELPEEISRWIIEQINLLRSNYYTIVHRDLRARHLLFSDKKAKPTLIDWEFSNVSEPAQDLAKLIYDGTIQSGLNKDELTRKIVDAYSYDKKMSPDEVEEKTMIFLPIIPLEHVMSFINRKPKGFEKEVMQDLCFIRSVYEQRK